MSSAHAYRPTVAERQAVFNAVGLDPLGRVKADAEVNPAKRKPLGLRAEPDDNEKADDPLMDFSFHFADGEHKALPEHALRSDWLFFYFDIVGRTMIELHNEGVKEVDGLWEDIKRKFREAEAAQRVETAELKATIAELRGEVASLRAVQESMRVAGRGERGEQGVRGIPGPPGEGRVGPAGPRGSDAVAIIGWEPNPGRFEIVPVLATGERSAPIPMRSLFEAYNAAVDGSDDA
jgi:hypothetical protein